jgi:ribosomal protein L37E
MIIKCPKCDEFDYETLLHSCWSCGYEKDLNKQKVVKNGFYEQELY